jgi:hypothetical protein
MIQNSQIQNLLPVLLNGLQERRIKASAAWR